MKAQRFTATPDPLDADAFVIVDVVDGAVLAGTYNDPHDAGSEADRLSLQSEADDFLCPPKRNVALVTAENLVGYLNDAFAQFDGESEEQQWNAETIEDIARALRWSFGRRVAVTPPPMMHLSDVSGPGGVMFELSYVQRGKVGILAWTNAPNGQRRAARLDVGVGLMWERLAEDFGYDVPWSHIAVILGWLAGVCGYTVVLPEGFDAQGYRVTSGA